MHIWRDNMVCHTHTHTPIYYMHTQAQTLGERERDERDRESTFTGQESNARAGHERTTNGMTTNILHIRNP
jgi:hypothetical protein